jgi:hypothetical protein
MVLIKFILESNYLTMLNFLSRFCLNLPIKRIEPLCNKMLVAITYGQFASSSPSAIVELGSTLEFAIVEGGSLLSLKVLWVHL